MARSATPLTVFDVLVATVSRHLLARVASAAIAAGGLPRYESGLRWRAIHAASRIRCPRCELAVVLAESADAIDPARQLATDLAGQTPTVVLLAPGQAAAGALDLPDVLVIAGPTDDPHSNLVAFSHAALAPCHATALADLDWADVQTLMASGSQAILEVGHGSGDEEALALLQQALEVSAPAPWYGALGSFATRHGGTMRGFTRLHKYAEGRLHADGMSAVSMTMIDNIGTDALATMLVITRPRFGDHSGSVCG